MNRSYRWRRQFRHPEPRLPRPCPSWCQSRHPEGDVAGARSHWRSVSPRVGIAAEEILRTGEWREPAISVEAEDITTVAEARGLALEILAAADLLEVGAR